MHWALASTAGLKRQGRAQREASLRQINPWEKQSQVLHVHPSIPSIMKNDLRRYTRPHPTKRHTHAHTFLRLPTRNFSLHWLWLLPWRPAYLSASRSAPRSLKVVCLMSSKLFSKFTQDCGSEKHTQCWELGQSVLNTKTSTFMSVCQIYSEFITLSLTLLKKLTIFKSTFVMLRLIS